MKIKFLGTGAAEGVPAMFCNCRYCKSIAKLSRKYYHTRSQIIIDEVLGIDFPPDAYSHALEFGVDLSKIEHLLISHSHMDHFYAHDFILRGYKYSYAMSAQNVTIYGNNVVKEVFLECTKREMKECVAPSYKLVTLNAYMQIKCNEYKVLALPSRHSSSEQTLMFYIEKDGKGYLNAYDSGWFNDEVYDFLKRNNAKIDLVVFDCTFLDGESSSQSRHMGIEANMHIKERLIKEGLVNDNTKYVITHFSHNSNPTPERLEGIERQYGVIAAYDGLEICI